jgi:hypothetical protein
MSSVMSIAALSRSLVELVLRHLASARGETGESGRQGPRCMTCAGQMRDKPTS